MNRQIIHYKITFTGPGNEVEIRYLVMETISYHNYLYFIRKLITLFPILKDLPFSVNWKDKEGDIVRICSDEELTIALDEMKADPVKKIFIIVKQHGSDTMLHPDIVCDGCDHSIKGFRYKCLICTDFELCSDCERSQAHPDHPMIRIPKPLSPDEPYGKQFSKDIPKISQNLEHLFQQTVDGGSQSNSNQKSHTDHKERFKFCQSEAHNIVANLLVGKLIKHNIETSMAQQKSQQEIHSSQHESSTSTDICLRNEPLNVLTNELKSLSIDVNSGVPRTEFLTEQDEQVHSTIGGQRLVTLTTTPFAANTFPSTTVERATTSEVLAFESNPMNPFISQIDAPIPADPTPVLQAQLTPPISTISIIPTPTVFTPIPVSSPSISSASSYSVATAPAGESVGTACSLDNYNFPHSNIYPKLDHASLDDSWSIIRNEQTAPPVSSCASVASIDSFEPTPLSKPQGLQSPLAKAIGPYAETIAMLHTLGFEQKEWLNLLVEQKKGDIKEVLKFLSPAKKVAINAQKKKKN